MTAGQMNIAPASFVTMYMLPLLYRGCHLDCFIFLKVEENLKRAAAVYVFVCERSSGFSCLPRNHLQSMRQASVAMLPILLRLSLLFSDGLCETDDGSPGVPDADS